MTLCNDAILEENGAQGEPTEAALVNFGAANGCPKPLMETRQPRCAEAPFDSSRKMMSTVHRTDTGFIQYTKGAPDEVLRRCTHYMENGAILPLTEEKRAAILADNKAMADKALRVLAAAQRLYDSLPDKLEPEDLEQDLCFIGLAGMIDPVRPEVKDAVAQCRAAGIRPVMITGDHKDTAVAIAKELGIITDASQAVTGSALDGLSDEELDNVIENYGVYARVQPEHKVRIVNAWRRKGAITAMTGDGVNDAPSIKSADIGVGMGITGTDVTKNVADMVLSDDNFATIVSAVGEGRQIYDNIRKAIQFLLASNMSEVLGVFFATLLGFTLLNPVHLLFINLITDCFPALALGLEKAEPDTMTRPPRNSRDGIFAGGVGFNRVKGFHRFDQADRIALGNRIAGLDIVWRFRVGRQVNHADHWRFDGIRAVSVIGIARIGGVRRSSLNRRRSGGRGGNRSLNRGIRAGNGNAGRISDQGDSAPFVFVFKFGKVAFIKNFSQFADNFSVQGV